jgi:Resolvase, N terminal domain
MLLLLMISSRNLGSGKCRSCRRLQRGKGGAPFPLELMTQGNKAGLSSLEPFFLKERFDTSAAAGRLIFDFFASLTQFERELIRERTVAGLAARGHLDGWVG